MKKILVIDDEIKIRYIYTRLLVQEGYIVRMAQDAREATNVLIREDIDLILLDLKMPEVSGKTMFEIIQEYDKKINVVVSSVYPVDEQKRRVPDAIDYFDKTKGVGVLLEKVKHVFQGGSERGEEVGA